MESVASVNFTELDLWDHLWMASGGQGSWFLALGFLSWVGLRIGQNIYNNAEINYALILICEVCFLT